MPTFDRYQYLWPPRPEAVIPPSGLDRLENLGWWVQPKMNGTNCLLYMAPGTGQRQTVQRGRHGDNPIKTWAPGPRWAVFTERLPPGWNVLHGELLHTKGTGRDTVYLHDVLVLDGQYLTGTSYADRYHLLRDLCKGSAREVTHREVVPGVWLAEVYTAGFRDRWEGLRGTGVEGVVGKNPAAKLLPCLRPASNAAWQVKCRFPTANASF